MITYVCGFYFNEDATEVALIRKNRPEWQAGKLNGIGGKVIKGEAIWYSMMREFREEAGVYTDHTKWTWFSNEGIPDEWLCYCVYATGDLSKVKTMTDEEIEIHKVDDIFTLPVIENLKTLIPFAAGQIDPYSKYNEDWAEELKERGELV